MALYRFLFAPVLLAVAVFTTSPRRATPPQHGPALQPAAAPAFVGPGHAPGRDARAPSSHPDSVR